MNTFALSQIIYDGFEGKAQLRPLGSTSLYNVYFTQYDDLKFDFTPSSEEIIADGKLNIIFVMKPERSNESMFFSQSPKGTPGVDAVVLVTKVVDQDQLFVRTSEFEEDILVDFEEAHECEAGQFIRISGYLQLEMEEYDM